MDSVSMEYYTAAWCGPCKTMGPVIEALRAEGWSVTKIDVDKEPERARNNGVMAMPTYLIYKDGSVVSRIVGARQKFALETELRLARDS